MKLINADDLKKYAQKLLVGESINTCFGVNLYKMFEEIIDNAPTVEAYPFEQVQELVKLRKPEETLREN